MKNSCNQNLPGSPESVWLATTPETDYPILIEGLMVDVAILGGGIAGLSAAFFLKKAGFKVAVIESQRIINGVTGNTTAKVTSLHTLIYSYLYKKFGEEKAFLYGQANQMAIEQIYQISSQHQMDCDFIRSKAYVYAEHKEALPLIENEVQIASRLSLPASFTNQTELPFPVQGAVVFDNQAHFHPRKYLLGLGRLIDGDGSFIFENTKALKVEDGSPCVVETSKGKIKAKHVIIATHQPFLLKGLFFARMHPNRSYALGVLLKEKVLEGMYINLGPVIRSFRPQPYDDGQILIIGGEDHQPGHVKNTGECYLNLENDAKKYFEVASIPYRWSAQDNMTIDKIPYIGRLTKSSKNVFVATGFNEWGMTHGTLSGMILCDQIMGKENPFSEVYDPSRHDALSSPFQFIKQNFTVGKDFLSGHLSIPAKSDEATIQKCEGKIIRKGLKKVAAYRDEEGKLHCVSPICTHLKCVVQWNGAEKSWDCPCHGSRFNYDGKVIQGPATEDLTKIDEL